MGGDNPPEAASSPALRTPGSDEGDVEFPDDPSLTGHFMIAIQMEAVMSCAIRRPAWMSRRRIKASPMWIREKDATPASRNTAPSSGGVREGTPRPPRAVR